MLTSISRDLRYALRLLKNRPGFSAVAVLTLALGIGGNTAIFSVVHGVLWGSVPFDDAEELVYIGEHSEQVPGMSVSYPNFLDFRDRSRSFDGLAAHRYQSYNLTGLERPEVLQAAQTSASLFPLLGVEALYGRLPRAEEDEIGSAAVTLVGYDFWNTRLGADPTVIGQNLVLDGQPYELIGVLPRGFHYPLTTRTIDLWMPIGHFAQRWIEQRGNHPGIYLTGRVKDGTTLDEARLDLENIAQALAVEYPDTNTGNGITFSSLTDRVIRDVRPALLVLMVTVAMVLLIACVNVANLLLARSTARSQEIAVRTALGSGTWPLARQLLTECLVLSLVAGVAGIAVAAITLRALIASAPAGVLNLFGDIELNAPVLLFTLGVSVLTGLVFGLFPVFQLWRKDLTVGLKEGSRGVTQGRGLLRSALVVAEVALAFILLVTALLFIQSFDRLTTVDLGFDPDRVLTLSMNLPRSEYPENEDVEAFVDELVHRVQALPGVEHAATTLPLLGGWQQTIIGEGMEARAAGDGISVDITRISPNYFDAMGVRLLRGRAFTERDRGDSPQVVIVDKTLAESFWPREDALGKTVKFSNDPADPDEPWVEIVGIVEHVRNYGALEPSRIEAYRPVLQEQYPQFTLVVRTSGDPSALSNPVQDAILGLDRDQAVAQVRSLAEITASSWAPQRLAASYLGAFAALALLLAVIGIYGVMAYSVAQRRHEIGVRMALGASAIRVLAMVVSQGARLVALGVAIGLGFSLLVVPLFSSQLYGIGARDPRTFATLPIVLGLVAVFACWIPAARASRVAPVVVLRHE